MPLRYVTGDATRPVLADGSDPTPERPALIVHVVNNVGAYGAGFAKAMARRFPVSRRKYQDWVAEDFTRGGDTLVHSLDGTWDRASYYVAHLLAQDGLVGPGHPHPLRYDWLADALRRVSSRTRTGTTVHMPRIGCGLAGGTWHAVGPIVESSLSDLDVFVYDLP